MRKRPGSDRQGHRHAPPRRGPEQQRHPDPVVLVRIRDPGGHGREASAPWSSSDRDIQDRFSR
jgi:hypothetical protein